MDLIQLTDNHSFGARSIDTERGMLVDTLNQLHDAMVKGWSRSLTGPLLKELVAHTRALFSAEETLLAKTQYSELERHRAEHVELTRKVEIYLGRFERGEVAIHPHLLNFLRDWMKNHLHEEDNSYQSCLNAHGIQ